MDDASDQSPAERLPPSHALASQAAYPVVATSFADGAYGLTKRELFAVMAMQSLISKAPDELLDVDDPGHLPKEIALGAVDYADALLAELSR